MSWASTWTGTDTDDAIDLSKTMKPTTPSSPQPQHSMSSISSNSSLTSGVTSGSSSPSSKIGGYKFLKSAGNTSANTSSNSLVKGDESPRPNMYDTVSSTSSTSSSQSNTPRGEIYQQFSLQHHQNTQFGKYGSDWSFMMAMDAESGKELHRSLTTMNLKYEGPGPSSSEMKSSNGMGPPPSPLLKGTSSPSPSPRPQLYAHSSSPGSSSTSLKLSGGMGPPPSGLSVTPTSITNSPITKKDKKGSNTSLSSQKKDSSGNMLPTKPLGSPAMTINSNSGGGSVSSSPAINIISNNSSANNSNSSSPISGSPITPSTTPPQTGKSGDFFSALLRKRKTSTPGGSNNGTISSTAGGDSPKSSPRPHYQRPEDDPLSPLQENEEDDYNYLNLNQSVSSMDKMYGWVEMMVSRHWKKLWFILRPPHLEYYQGWWGEDKNNPNNQNTEDTGKILLNYWFTFTPIVVEDNNRACFSMIQSSDVEKSSKKESKIKFRCEDEATARRWISEMEEVIKRRKETTVTIRPLAKDTPVALAGGRRPTITGNSPFAPQNLVNPLGPDGEILPSLKLQMPQEMMDELEPDEKASIELVKGILDEFPAKSLPEGETVSSYRAKRRASDGYYRVLSMDGGGLRSVMVCILVERIVKRFPDFLEHIDVFTGTSAGSIVAAGLACEYPPKATRRVLELTALPVFGKKRFNNVQNAKYNNRVLKAGCYVFFQDKKFNEIPRKLAVPAFQLDSEWPLEAKEIAPEVRRWQPRVFHNLGDCNTYLTTDVVGDVLLRSGAAPTYFPSYKGYIDGGVFANNPALSAMTLAMSPSLDGIPSDKIICLSIGTGLSPHFMEGGQDYDWGLLNWAPKLGNLLIGAQVDYLTQLCDNILGDRHFRLNPPLGESTSMDDPKLVTELATLANAIDLEDTFKWIEKYFLPKN